jgi:hypothetical protein
VPSRRNLAERFFGRYLLTLADMNGDGLADLVGVGGRNRVVYWPSDGRGNFTACTGPGCPCEGPGHPTNAAVMPARDLVTDNPTRDVHFADLNGDGFADLIQLVPDGVLIFLNDNGIALRPPIHVDKPGLGPTDKWDADSVTIGFADMAFNAVMSDCWRGAATCSAVNRQRVLLDPDRGASSPPPCRRPMLCLC